MKERPRDVTGAAVRQALTAWGIQAVRVAYAPVGFADHHWTAEEADGRRWFVTVADLAGKELPLGSCPAETPAREDGGPQTPPAPDDGRDAAESGLLRAMDTAAALRDAGLDFVAAPERARDGRTLRRLGRGYAVSVFRHEPGTAGEFGERLDTAERRRVLDLLAALHRAKPPAGMPVQCPRPAALERLESALGALDRTWHAGPYAEPARKLLAGHASALWEAMAEFGRLAGHVAPADAVVTHGEPHPGNVLRQPGGRRVLVDWDTVALAPPERDLWLVAAGEEDLARYEAASGHRPDPTALAFYRLRWALEDVALYASDFRRRHGRGADTATAWSAFAGTLAAGFPRDPERRPLI
jgi:spectinomycin phosphotransferase